MEKIIQKLKLEPYLAFSVKFRKEVISFDFDFLLGPLLQCLDRYNDFFFVEEVHKKCLIYKKDFDIYEYHFPFLSAEEEPLKVMIDRPEYDSSYYIIFEVKDDTSNLIFTYPEGYQIVSDFTDNIDYGSNLPNTYEELKDFPLSDLLVSDLKTLSQIQNLNRRRSHSPLILGEDAKQGSFTHAEFSLVATPNLMNQNLGDDLDLNLGDLDISNGSINFDDIRFNADSCDLNLVSIEEKIARCYLRAVECLDKELRDKAENALYKIFSSSIFKGNGFIESPMEKRGKRKNVLTLMDIECNIKDADKKIYEIMKNRTFEFSCLYSVISAQYAASRIFWELYRTTYVCSDLDKRTFYYFEDHGWSVSNCALEIKTALSRRFPSNIIQMRDNVRSSSDDSVMVSSLEKLTTSLCDVSFKAKVLTECCVLFSDRDFLKKINKNNNLLRFENGIYDLSSEKLREGRPDDYITLGTNIFYEEYSPDEEEFKEIEDLLRKVFPVPNIRKYFARFLSSCLEAGNKDKIFSIWSGLGDNGKSVMVKLIERCFGDYSIKLPTSLITGKRTSSSSATPELAIIEGRLVAFVQEPDDEETVRNGILKELTGGDSIYVRGIFEKGRNINVKTKLIFIVNKQCNIPSTDIATWNRIRVIPFMSKFVNEIKESDDKERTFLKDVRYDEKLEKLAPAFMHFLVKEYRNYKLYGLEEPKEITEATEKFRRGNDPLGQFILSVITTDVEGSISIKEIYIAFKEWHKSNFPTSRAVNIDEFRTDIEKHNFKINSVDQIVGIRVNEYL